MTVTADDKSKIYGDANPAFTVSYSGFVLGENQSALSSEPTASASTDATSNAGSHTISVSEETDKNYDIIEVTGTLTINKAPLTATADDQSKTYGDANPAFSISYSGFLNGDDASDLDTQPTASSIADETSDVNTYTISVSEETDNNYEIDEVDGTLTVNKKTLTATAEDKTKVYGESNPEFTITYSGFAGTDDASVIDTPPTVSNTATSSSDAGTYIISLSAGIDNNYSITEENGTLTITKKPLEVTAEDQSKTYGEADPTFTVIYSGFVNGEDESVLNVVPHVNDIYSETTDAGSYTLSFNQGGDNNYELNHNRGTFTINKKSLTATAIDQSREYGELNPELSINYSGFVNGEDVSVLDTPPLSSTSAAITSSVGSYDINLSTGIDNNYVINGVNGLLTITKATLTIEAGDKTKTYGDVNPTATLTYSGFKNSDDSTSIDHAPIVTINALESSATGTYPITVIGGSDDNYDFDLSSSTGTLTIEKAPLRIIADDKARTYGEANPPLTLTFQGFVLSEDESVINTIPSVSTSANILSNVGVYTIMPSGGADNNYEFTLAAGQITVTKATLNVRADDKTREYGLENPGLSLTYTSADFKNGETSSVIASEPTINTLANTSSDAGTYDITLSGGDDENYVFAFQSGTLTISKATLMAQADDQTKVYGEANPSLSTTFTGFRLSDDSAVLDIPPSIMTFADERSNVGSYDIILTGGDDNNYVFDLSSSTGTLTINKKDLEVSADNITREYGESNPTLTVSYRGFVNEDNENDIDEIPSITNSATALTNVGTSDITLQGGSDNNYNLINSNGTLTITKATLSILANDKSKVYGQANPDFTFQYMAGFKNGETESVIDTQPTAETAATNLSDAGTYEIFLNGGGDNNYQFAFTSGELTIEKAILEAQVANSTRPYGDSNDFSIIYSGFVNADDVSQLDTPPLFVTEADETTLPGTQAVSLTGGSDNNYTYDLSQSAATLTITKRDIDVIPNNRNRYYGDDNPDLTYDYKYEDFVNGDTREGIDDPPEASTLANKNSDAGGYDITLGPGFDDRYTLVRRSGTLMVEKAPLGVIADNKERPYGDPNPQLSFKYVESDFKLGQDHTVLETEPIPGTEIPIVERTPARSYTINFDDNPGSDSNYDFVFTNGTFDVNKVALTITVQDTAKCFGEPNPGFTTIADNLKNGETLDDLEGTIMFSTNATTNSPSGIYPVSASGLAPTNYDIIDYVSGNLIIYENTGIISQPQDQNGCHRDIVIFSIEVDTEQPEVFYQWFMQPNETSSWVALQEGVHYENTTSRELIVKDLKPDMDGQRFRVEVSTNQCSNVISEEGLLTVNATPPFSFIKVKAHNILINTDPGRDKYYWGIGEDTIRDANRQFHQFENPFPADMSDYWGAACNSNGCCTKSFVGDVSLDPSTAFINSFNPRLKANQINSTVIEVVFQGPLSTNARIHIYDQSGVFQESITGELSSTSPYTESFILTRPYGRGIYFVVIESPEGLKHVEKAIIL